MTVSEQAEHYDSLVGQITRQAVDALLNAVSASSRARLLDVASGPGYVAAEATRRCWRRHREAHG